MLAAMAFTLYITLSISAGVFYRGFFVTYLL